MAETEKDKGTAGGEASPRLTMVLLELREQVDVPGAEGQRRCLAPLPLVFLRE